jgi:uncharacterized membrane protein
VARRRKPQAPSSPPAVRGTTPPVPTPPPSRSPRAVEQQAYAEFMAFSGPLPPPDLLVQYNAALPGLAERVIAAWERQGNHRQHLERVVIEGDTRRAYLGIASALVISVIVLLIAYALIETGHDWAGAALGLGELAALTGTFIYGTQQRQRELAAKQQRQPPLARQ